MKAQITALTVVCTLLVVGVIVSGVVARIRGIEPAQLEAYFIPGIIGMITAWILSVLDKRISALEASAGGTTETESGHE